MSEQNIPNWSIYGAGRITLAVFDCPPTEEGDQLYQGALMIQLDDGEGDELTTDPEEAKCLTIMTDVVLPSKNDTLCELVDGAMSLFSEMADTVLHFDVDGDVKEAILLEDILANRLDDDN